MGQQRHAKARSQQWKKEASLSIDNLVYRHVQQRAVTAYSRMQGSQRIAARWQQGEVASREEMCWQQPAACGAQCNSGNAAGREVKKGGRKMAQAKAG